MYDSLKSVRSNMLTTKLQLLEIFINEKVSKCELFSTVRKVNEFLNNRFSKNMQPKYCIKEIYPEDLEEERRQNHKKLFKSINGSASFQSSVGFSSKFSRF